MSSRARTRVRPRPHTDPWDQAKPRVRRPPSPDFEPAPEEEEQQFPVIDTQALLAPYIQAYIQTSQMNLRAAKQQRYRDLWQSRMGHLR